MVGGLLNTPDQGCDDQPENANRRTQDDQVREQEQYTAGGDHG